MAGDASWVVDIRDDLVEAEYYWKAKAQLWKEKAEHWKKPSIYKAPAYITDMNPKAYLPQLVSFGPYHHDKEHLKPMEEHKHRALVNFINRSGKPFTRFVEAMSKVLDDLMACYDLLDQKWRDNRDAFLQLMILDGCFMLEFLRTATTWVVEEYDYTPDDPIFSDHAKTYIMPYVQKDILMLENQLPMLALDTLVGVESDGSKDEEFVNKLILKFYFPFTPAMGMGKEKCLHVLDVFRKRLLFHKDGPSNNINSWPRRFKPKFTKFHSATELDEAGIQLSKSKSCFLESKENTWVLSTGSLEDVSFRSGVLRLPVIVVDEASESTFLNLIAFERSHVGAGSEVTSYLYLMSKLLSNERDVALLHSKGIIWNALGRDEEVARLFKYLTKEIRTIPLNKISLVFFRTISYCEKPWRKNRAKVVHAYFRSPWNIVNLIGAIFLFVLAVVQTIYTIYK